MEYIQCTHCGKRYEVSDQIREAEGQFTTCQVCKEKFLMVIHDEEKQLKQEEDDAVISTGGWDPSLTMPAESDVDSNQDGAIEEQYLDDELDDGAEVLAALQAARKKKKVLYAAIGVGVCLLLGGAWLVLQEDTSSHGKTTQQQHSNKPVTLSAKEHDKASAECRHAAAQQWLMDYKAMHADYSGDEFVRLLKSSEQQIKKVHEVCKSKILIKEIIIAATSKEKPGWFKAEIEVMQANRKR